MLNAILIFLQISASLVLVLFILLHAGRGGGLSDMLGGGAAGGSMAGSTVVEKNLDRMTVVAALIWILATMALGLRL